VEEISHVLINVNEEEAVQFSNELVKAKRIFVCGEGRSGLMGKAFAMRLMHADYTVFVVGETITPSIQEGDLFVAISGSGETSSIYQLVEKAKKVRANVQLVTVNKDSSIGNIADGILVVPAATKYRLPSEAPTIQPLGNQFDQSVHLLLDAIIISTLKEASNEELRNRHANLE
jgi:6-phospho-3-hexuloisomerase